MVNKIRYRTVHKRRQLSKDIIVHIDDIEMWASTTRRGHFIDTLAKAKRVKADGFYPIIHWLSGNKFKVEYGDPVGSTTILRRRNVKA